MVTYMDFFPHRKACEYTELLLDLDTPIRISFIAYGAQKYFQKKQYSINFKSSTASLINKE